eukprot:jgi/Tetstr1/453801/TSEL_040753.t2
MSRANGAEGSKRRALGAESYVPPHRRGQDGAGRDDGGSGACAPGQKAAAGAEGVPRSLDDIAGGSRVEVALRLPLGVDGTEASALLDSCPYDSIGGRGGGDGALQFPRLWTEEHAQELLQWFSEAFAPGRGGSGRRWGDTGGRGSAGGAELRLPASFTKEERKEWHRLAQHCGLHTQSRGVGPGRYLSVCAARPGPDGAPPPGQPDAASKAAKKVWRWCQAEGGKHWQLSQGEIADMLASPEGLPADLKALCARKEAAQSFGDALRRGDAEEGLRLLRAAQGQGAEAVNSLVWHRDESSGSYPLHVAVRKGLVRVVEALATLPNVLTQKDRDWQTAFDVCEDAATGELLCRLRAERG